jgi:hypothetical protein
MSHLLDPPIVLAGELSKDDVLTADRMLTTKQRKRTRASTFIAALGLFVGLGIWLREHDEEASDRVFLAAMVVLPVFAFAPILIARYRVHQAWTTKSGIFACAETTITNDGLVMRMPHAVSNAEWAMFYAAMIRPTAIILFYEGAWMLFARSRFPDESDWIRFTSFVQLRFEIIHEL